MSDEVVEGESQPNLFVHSLSQAALSPGATTGAPEGGRTMNAGDRSLANRRGGRLRFVSSRISVISPKHKLPNPTADYCH